MDLSHIQGSITGHAKGICRSVWLFPLFLLLPLILLTAFKISGSSIGTYYSFFYGAKQDPSLIGGIPRMIRSDEWNVNTPMSLAQANDGYRMTNNHLGHGQDMSMFIDVPYKDWSEFFKPQNWPFFVLPFEYAFALKWWLMAYLLVVSCYFFVLKLVPGRKTLAALLSLSLLFAPFLQWWYQFITLAPVYYSFMLATGFMYLMDKRGRRASLLITAAMVYILTGFALILYPPFQISCGLVLAAFCFGYTLESERTISLGPIVKRLVYPTAAIIIAAGFFVGFLGIHHSTIRTVSNTAYPGKRIVKSGGFSLSQLFSGYYDRQLQYDSRSIHYSIPQNLITNQSEAASFIFISPLLAIPTAFLVWRRFRESKTVDWVILTTIGAMMLLLAWFLVPGLGILGKLTLLNKVPLNRAIIGIGLADFILFVLFIRLYMGEKKNMLRGQYLVLYALIVFTGMIGLGLHQMSIHPGYMGHRIVLLIAGITALITYFLVKRQFTLAAFILFCLAILSSGGVNPLYRGTGVITQNKLTDAISNISSKDPRATWIVEDINIESYALSAGVNSLSTIYTYPQFGIWRLVDKSRQQGYIYNRYAHVNFNFDRSSKTIPTQLSLVGEDHFAVSTEACSDFMKTNNIRYIVVDVPIRASCLRTVRTVIFPARTFIIYKLE